MPATPEARLKELNLTLPAPGRPMARYKMAVRVGNLLYVSGHGPARVTPQTPVAGRVGAELTAEQGKESARAVGLAILATLRDQLGSLDRVVRLVKTLGMVNCTPDFKDQPAVINGYSELMAEVFGEDAGVGARSAVGMGSLPMNIPVEIEAIFEVRD
jgi:enamine deaminase RidA (YjgF/YER057c/UK114 family)